MRFRLGFQSLGRAIVAGRRTTEGDIMNVQSRMALLVAALAGVTMSAGCGDQSSQPVGQRTSPTADKMASATDRATTTAAKNAEDDAISAKVKAAIVADPGLSTLQIDVDTKNSVVTLNGTVDTAMSKERAEQIAQNVGGVRSVIDNLTVKAA
jgi:hyperosmotically inducible protein